MTQADIPAPGPSGGTGPTTVGHLAAVVGGQVIGRDDLVVTGIETMDRAGPGHVTFIRSNTFGAEWAKGHAGAALVSHGVKVDGHDTKTRALIVVPDADMSLNLILEHFATRAPARLAGRHPSATVDPSATIAASAWIGPNCVIGAGASVADGAVLTANVYLGRDTKVGSGTVLHPGVTLYDRTEIGRQCAVHAGSVLGSDGFGYRSDQQGGGLVKIPHIGNVVIHDDVEIGANSCVDRAKFGSTVIGSGTKIDNLVQIGHNCHVGRCCVLCGGVGIGGSCTLGDGVMMGGKSGLRDNINVGPGAKIGAASNVWYDVPAGETWLGSPARPLRENLRNESAFRTLSKTLRKLVAKAPELGKHFGEE
ncbi:MAG: UDP-3-O-(3-hydroxymyristoyl)glucosamine N-acyltransferase [Planctomycetota bacterium]